MNKYIITCLFIACSFFYVQAQEIEPELPDSTEQPVYEPILSGEPYTQAEQDSILAEIRQMQFMQETFSDIPLYTPPPAYTINKNNLVGEIPIQYSQDKNGGVNYTVPLEIHPGRSGLQPNLSLAYNSMRGNSILGYGWGLAGLSAITPVNKTIYYNSDASPINLTQTDVFALDGVYLFRNNPHHSGIIYYETVQGNIRVEGYVSNNIITHFKATTPDGKQITYGYPTNTTGQYQYPITEIKDVNGNYVSYTYELLNNIYYISRIDYGGHNIFYSYGNSPHFASVRFTYSEHRFDNYTVYIGGKEIRETRLIKNISSYYEETLLRTYTPDYVKTDVSMLQQIKCEAGGKQFNPLSFNYMKDEQGEEYNYSITNIQPYNKNVELIYNKVKFEASSPDEGLIVYPNHPTYGSSPQNPSVNGSKNGSVYPANEDLQIYTKLSDSGSIPVIMKAGDGFHLLSSADIDGDNNEELVKVNYTRFVSNDTIGVKIQVSIYDKDCVQIKSHSFKIDKVLSPLFLTTSLVQRRFFVGDFDGDGKAELFSISSEGRVNLFKLDNMTMVANQKLDKNAINVNQTLFLLDYNGDGKLEICNITIEALNIFSFNGSNNSSKQLDHIYSGNTHALSYENPGFRNTFLLGDINGDGKTDIMYCQLKLEDPYEQKWIPMTTWKILYSKGKGGFEKKDTGIRKYVSSILQDINNDGFPELVIAQNGEIFTYLNEKGTFRTYEYRIIKDMQDSPDQVKTNFQLIPCNISQYPYQRTFLCIKNNRAFLFGYIEDRTRSRLLTEATNSFGVKNYHSYKRLDEPGSNYHQDTQASGSPYSNLFGKIHLNETMQTCSPDGKTVSNISYEYHDGVIHKQGLGFCGFKTVNTMDSISYRRITQTFDPYKYGLPVSEDSPEATMNHSYTFKPNTARIIRFNKTTSQVYDKLKGTTHSSEVYYDDYGNAVSEITDYGSGIKTRVDREFRDPALHVSTGYRTDLPEKEVLTKYIGNKSSSTTTIRYYDYGNLISALSYYDSLLVKEQEFILDYESGSRDNILASKEKNYNAGQDRWIIGTSFRYDSKGRMIQETNPLGLSSYYTYDPVYGRLESTKNHKEQVTYYFYDELGRLVETKYPDHTYKFTTFEWSKNVMEGTPFPPRGEEEMILEYEDFPSGTYAACKKITLHPGFSFQAAADKKLSLEINKDGCLRTQPYGYLTYVVTTAEYGKPDIKKYMDVFNREIRTSQRSFDGVFLNTDTEYDYKGRVSRKSQPLKAGFEPRWNNYTYDSHDRLKKITYYSGKSDEFRYNGNEVTSIVGGITSTKKYNSAGQLVQVRDTAGTIAYNYRPDGQPELIIAPGGITTSFEYDNYGRKVKLIDPSAGTQTYAYDEEGRLVSEAEGEGLEIIYSYDNLNRVTSKIRSEYNTQYAYDNEGKLQSETSDNGTSRLYTYDEFDRVASVKESTGDSLWIKTSYVYGNNLLQYIKHESNEGIIAEEEYTHEWGRHTETVLLGTGTIFKLKAEDESGRTTQVETGKLTRNYGYDMYGLPTSRSVSLLSGTALYDQHYEFDLLTGNLKYRKDAKRNITESFGYDHLNRLTSLNGDTYVSFDDKGNITYRAGIGYFEYNHSSKPYAVTDLIQTNSVVPSGNQEITTLSNRRFGTISENGYFAQFQYDSSEDRIKMRVKYNDEDYLTRYYIGSRYERDITPTHTKEKLYLGGDAYSASAVYVKEDNGEWKLHFLLRDYLGSIAQVTDSNGVLVQELSYDPWGRLRNPDTHEYYASSTEPELFLGRGYTGHEHLAMFGLINMNARLYDPVTGRFLSPDPYVQAPDFSQNYNRYSYCLNNPFKYTDPTGEFPWIPLVFFAIHNGLMQGSLADINGGSFWGGFAKGAGVSAGSSLLTFGVGEVFGHTVGSAGTELLRATSHGLISGGANAIQGGDFGLGFGTGFVSSLAGSGMQAMGWDGNYLPFVTGAVGAGTAWAMGGDPMNGFQQGYSIGSLNHKGEKIIADDGSICVLSCDDAVVKGMSPRTVRVVSPVVGDGLDILVELALTKGIFSFFKTAKAARAARKTFFEGAKYSDKVLSQMDKADDMFHNFPKSVDAYSTKFGRWSTKVGGDGKVYPWLEMSGSYGGKSGVFEYIKNPITNEIDHRFFKLIP